MNGILGLQYIPWGWNGKHPVGNIIAVIIVVLAVGIIIFFNRMRNKGKFNNPSLGGSELGAHKYGAFTLYRLARSAGLDRDQTKMLDFVFKTDEVIDPSESLQNPELLDRHFKRAYQTITEGAAGRETAEAEPAAAKSSTATDVQERLTVLFSTRNMLEGGSITSTRQIPEDTDTVIKVGKESYPSKVVSVNMKNLTVENPQDAAGVPLKLERNSRVILSFFAQTEKGFSVETQVLGTGESGEGSRLYLAHSNRLQYESLRRFRRKQTALSADLQLVHLEEQKMVLDNEKLAGQIMDISIGGCGIQTNSSIPSATRLKIEFSPNPALKAAALGQVLRTNQNGASTVMHIKFLKVPRRSMNAINALVFEYSDR
jgi:c-di-GMP-binding flagellar brake protein YcgR